MNLITTLTAYPPWGSPCTRKIHRPLQMSRLALLIATALVNSPSYAKDLYYTLNEDAPSLSIDLSSQFATVAWSWFHSNNNNPTLLQTAHSDWHDKVITLTLQPNQFGTATIETWADTTIVSLIPYDDKVWLHITVTPVNDAPSFTASNLPAVMETTGTHTVTNWVTSFNPGPNETDSVLAYQVSNITNPSLFAAPPSVNPSGTLTYTLAPDQYGTSNFEVTVQDNGGTANGGVDLSTPITFSLLVLTPEIRVRQGGASIPSGGSFDVGPAGISGRVTYLFTIDNIGNSDLLLRGTPKIGLSGNNAGEFSIDETSITSPLVGSGSTTFLLNFLPNSVGPKTATLSIAHNDFDEGDYTLALTGTATPSKLLHITFAGTGQGSVTSDLKGVACETVSQVCSSLPVINAPQWVTLTPVPATGSEFIGWTGDAACQTNGQVLVINDTACTATFGLKNYQLTGNFLGKGRVTGPGIDCPGQCTVTYLYGTTVTLKAQVTRKMWEFSGWQGCDSQGNIQITNDVLCQAVFTPDPNIPNAGDGNGDGLPDAYQDNVVSLPDKVTGTYLTLETQPATCVISDIYPDLAESQTIKLDQTKKFPQGMLYFDIACPQAQVSVYYHGMSKLSRNLKFYKFGPKTPGDLTTIGWYQLPNVKYELVTIGGQPVVKGTYTLKDGELGDSTGVDGKIVDPAGLELE